MGVNRNLHLDRAHHGVKEPFNRNNSSLITSLSSKSRGINFLAVSIPDSVDAVRSRTFRLALQRQLQVVSLAIAWCDECDANKAATSHSAPVIYRPAQIPCIKLTLVKLNDALQGQVSSVGEPSQLGHYRLD